MREASDPQKDKIYSYSLTFRSRAVYNTAMRLIAVLIICLLSTPALAATIELNTGEVIKADKVTVSDDAIIATINGMNVTYFPEDVAAVNDGAPGGEASPGMPAAPEDSLLHETETPAGRVAALTETDKDEIREAYADYHQVLMGAETFEDLKDVLSEDQYNEARNMLKEGGMGESQILGMIKMMSPADPQITDVVLENGKVILKAEAMGMVGKGQGTVEFEKSSGRWKVVHEHWNFGDAKSDGAQEDESAKIEKGSDWVTGTFRGEPFTVDRVIYNEFMGTIDFQQGDRYSAEKSLMVFLFLDSDEDPDGKSFSHQTSSNDEQTVIKKPHIHLNWKEEKGGKAVMSNKVYTQGYTLNLTFDWRNGNILPGAILLSINDDPNTQVTGTFQAAIKRQ